VCLILVKCMCLSFLYQLCKHSCTKWLNRGGWEPRSSERVHYKLVSEQLVQYKLVSEKIGTLQIGIRAKVSTLSLDGPVERSLDRKWEEKLGQEWPISDVGLFQCVK
jgi:hypothetical protein